MKFLLSAALVGPAFARPSFLNARADTTTIGTFDVYNVSECLSTGVNLVAVNKYSISSTECFDTPPNPDLALLPFLSYRASVTPPSGETCFFDVFAGEGCTDNYQGFAASASNYDTCQEVVVATTGNDATIGAKSVRMSCRNLSA